MTPETITDVQTLQTELYTEPTYPVPHTNGDSPAQQILFLTSYPPRECGIATYSQDLIRTLNNKFNTSFGIKVCALETEMEQHGYAAEVIFSLDTDQSENFTSIGNKINTTPGIRMVVVQHEFGLFEKHEEALVQLLKSIEIPIIIAFHTVLPQPHDKLLKNVQQLSSLASACIVMTHFSEAILINDYALPAEKITVIPHGTHLAPYAEKSLLRDRYDLSGRQVLATFGLLSSGKNIETTLRALPKIIASNPEVLFLIIGKTHPIVVKHDGEIYRSLLEQMVIDLGLTQNVRFINRFLPLPMLLDYLQLTDVYIFTSKDPNQAVSGTFSYAISAGCPVVSTPIPHAREVLKDDGGIIIDFENDVQLAKAVGELLNNEQLRTNIGLNALHKMAPTAWENSAIAHARLFERICGDTLPISYTLPPIKLDHIERMTTEFGIIQFSKINQPDIDSGYTLDDNARALIAMCQYYQYSKNIAVIPYIKCYFNFIKYCLGTEGHFTNYVNGNHEFTSQNNLVNLADANGRAVWALGYLTAMSDQLPPDDQTIGADAVQIIDRLIPHLTGIQSTRAMAFTIKGLYYRDKKNRTTGSVDLLYTLANRLVQMYRHESDTTWHWFESYLTYANSILPEAMLCAWVTTGEPVYKEIAVSSFDFLLSKTFSGDMIKVISNKTWLHKTKLKPSVEGGEQPIDVAYTVLALAKFYSILGKEDHLAKMQNAFSWFHGNNSLHQIIYNPATGGCYDGLEDNYVNLNQGAESSVSYLMARLTLEEYARPVNLAGYRARKQAKINA